MAGKNNSSSKLNTTLIKIAKILNKLNLKNWFIGYGTLLGIVRNNSCIEGDDDVDILCNKNDYAVIKNALSQEGFKITYGHGINTSQNILKTVDTSMYCSVDFYMCEINNNGDFHDKWERVIWTGCFNNNELIKRSWKDTTIYLPHDYEKKLIGRYGDNWKTPQDSKGVTPKKTKL